MVQHAGAAAIASVFGDWRQRRPRRRVPGTARAAALRASGATSGVTRLRDRAELGGGAGGDVRLPAGHRRFLSRWRRDGVHRDHWRTAGTAGPLRVGLWL